MYVEKLVVDNNRLILSFIIQRKDVLIFGLNMYF